MPTYDGIRVYGGDIVSADDVNANIPSVYVKANLESRNTTTTLAADGELVGIPLEVGVYEIELMLFFSCASTTPIIKTRWIFSGVWNSPVRACLGPGSDNVTAVNRATTVAALGNAADTANAVYGPDGTGTYSLARELTRNAIVTTAGTLALHWAQNVSNAANTTVQPGTSFTVRKISD